MGITIIDHTKPPSPILLWKPKPSFRTSLEKSRYWAAEKVKWINGVGDIPGTLYFKTQELKIKHRVKGHIFRPACRDVDLLIHQTIRDCIKTGEADVLIKGRGLGLSSEFGCLANYYMKVYPGTTSFLTSQDKEKIASLFSEKVAISYDNMDEDIKPVEVRRNETKSSSYIKVEQLYINQYGKEELGTSQVLCRETSDSVKSASAFSGQGAILGCYDEIFLHKRRRELVRSSTSCYVDPETKKVIGFLFAGGTVEDTLTNAELSELAMLIEEIQTKGRLETMKARLTFIPSWMGSNMINGWSNEKLGMENWYKEIEELEKLKDPAAVRAFRMNNPMSLDDIFELARGGMFEDDVANLIKEQYKIVLNTPSPEETVNLLDMGETIVKQQNKKGNVTIMEEPRENVQYFLCIDGVATGKEVGSAEGSNVAGTMCKMFDTNGLIYAPVCIYTERPKTVEQSYINLVAQAKYYNKFGGFKGFSAEANAGTADHFASFLYKAGMEKYIIDRKDLSGKGNSNTKKSFQYVTIDVRNFQIRAANIFLRKHIGNIKMKQLLLDLMKSVSENADIRDSWFMFFIAANDLIDKPIAPPRTKKLRTQFSVWQMNNGVRTQEWYWRYADGTTEKC